MLLRAVERCAGLRLHGRPEDLSADELVEQAFRHQQETANPESWNVAAFGGVVCRVAAQTQEPSGFGNGVYKPLRDRLPGAAACEPAARHFWPRCRHSTLKSKNETTIVLQF